MSTKRETAADRVRDEIDRLFAHPERELEAIVVVKEPADSIRWAVDVGTAEGFSDGTFRPNPVTRQQSTSFVVRWLSTVEHATAELP